MLHKLHFKNFINSTALIGLIICFFIFNKSASKGALTGILICGNTLIPSLFPFMIISGVIATTSVSKIFSAPLTPLTRYIYHLPKCCGTIILMSLIGGFPVGARLISEYLDMGIISKKQAETMLSFCVNAGPAFIITAVGVGMFKSAVIGIIIFISCTVSSLIVGAIFCAKEKSSHQINDVRNIEYLSISNSLVSSVNKSVFSMLSICGFVVFFSFLGGIIKSSGIANLLPSLYFEGVINGILEVTCGAIYISKIGSVLAVCMVSAIISFSSLSIWAQISAMVSKHNLSLKLFVISRFISAPISFIFCRVLLYFSGSAVTTSIGAQNISAEITATSPVGAVALVLLCAVFTLYNSALIGKKSAD